MSIRYRRIHHLGRYTTAAGFLIFFLYLTRLFDPVIMFLLGPPIYVAYTFRAFLGGLFPGGRPSGFVDAFVFLLPFTLLYYGAVGFLLKRLWNEHGRIRLASLIALGIFLVYIHITSGSNLLSYLGTGP